MAQLVSHAMEDYVAAIWRLTQNGGAASTSEVARKLGVTAASTTYMFKRMAEAGLVDHKEYAGATLTAAGEAAAMSYVRRHRITERFLVDVLGIPWDRADAASDQMEHALPDEVIDRMAVVMGEPTVCPHGYPIPTKDGHLPDMPVRPISELQNGEAGIIAQVAEYDPATLRYLTEHHLVPGQAVSVLDRDVVGETMTLRIGDGQVIVGVAIARKVSVRA